MKPIAPPTHEPSWYLVALAELGTQEMHGDVDNPRIQEYLAATTLGAGVHDETPWCSAFANWCMRRAGMPGTGRANARSWLDWGAPLSEPKLGCVAVFSRDAAGPTNGHVGFYAGSSRLLANVRVLGGNQHNRVCIADYPLSRLLGYRWPKLTPSSFPIPRPHG